MEQTAEKSRRKIDLSQYFIIIIFVVVMVLFTILKTSFIYPANLINILKQASINGVLAFGMMFVIICGGFDMSVGSTLGLAGVLAALVGNGNFPLVVPLLVALVVGFAVGMANGIGVVVGNLPPFIMTMGTLTAVRGLAMISCNSIPVTGVSQTYRNVASATVFGGFPVLAFYFIGAIVLSAFILNKTVFGRRMYATGGNVEAARVAGINTGFMRVASFAIVGVAAGLAGFLMTARTTVGQPSAGESYELDAIAACVVGGVSMSGGVGRARGVVIGVLLITAIANGLDILGVNSNWQKVAKGAIIIIAVLIDVRTRMRKN